MTWQKLLALVGQGSTVYHIRGHCQAETGAQLRSEEQVGFCRLQQLSLFKGLEVSDLRVYTMGFSQKSAEDFFGKLQDVGIKRLIDVRLNNTSQLAGFTKRNDLAFFLKQLCGAEYIHEPLLTPTQEMFDAYRKKEYTWQEFERKFLELMAERKIEKRISKGLFGIPTVLLCSESSAKYCHRRLVLEYLQEKWGGLEVVHL